MRKSRFTEDETQRLKGLVADLTLDEHMLQEVLRKEFQGPLRSVNALGG